MRLHGEPQHRGEPQRPHDAQGVLVKALVRVAYAAQDAPAQVVPAAVQVGDIPPHIHGHGVHRQIAARQILRQRVGKVHGVGTAVVGVGAVGAEGGDLHGEAVLPDGDGAVAQAGGDTVSRKQGGHLLRSGGGGHVPILRHAAQQGIADAAAHGVGRKTGLLQPCEDHADLLGKHIHRLLSRQTPENRLKSRLHFVFACIIMNRCIQDRY